MSNKEKILFSRKLGKTRRSSRERRGRRETNLHFSETVLKENYILERKEWLK
jgi:hypothetical protein